MPELGGAIPGRDKWTRRMEFGWVLDDGTYLCDGCNVREGHMHRCGRGDGAWQDGRVCDCTQCKEPSADELAAFRAEMDSSRES